LKHRQLKSLENALEVKKEEIIEEEQPSEIKIKKTIEEIKEIKQMLQLLIKKKGLELEKEDKQPMLTVSTLQLGVWVTNSQQDSDLVKALEGSANERIEAISGEELGVKDRLENR